MALRSTRAADTKSCAFMLVADDVLLIYVFHFSLFQNENYEIHLYGQQREEVN